MEQIAERFTENQIAVAVEWWGVRLEKGLEYPEQQPQRPDLIGRFRDALRHRMAQPSGFVVRSGFGTDYHPDPILRDALQDAGWQRRSGGYDGWPLPRKSHMNFWACNFGDGGVRATIGGGQPWDVLLGPQ